MILYPNAAQVQQTQVGQYCVVKDNDAAPAQQQGGLMGQQTAAQQMTLGLGNHVGPLTLQNGMNNAAFGGENNIQQNGMISLSGALNGGGGLGGLSNMISQNVVQHQSSSTTADQGSLSGGGPLMMHQLSKNNSAASSMQLEQLGGVAELQPSSMNVGGGGETGQVIQIQNLHNKKGSRTPTDKKGSRTPGKGDGGGKQRHNKNKGHDKNNFEMTERVGLFRNMSSKSADGGGGGKMGVETMAGKERRSGGYGASGNGYYAVTK